MIPVYPCHCDFFVDALAGAALTLTLALLRRQRYGIVLFRWICSRPTMSAVQHAPSPQTHGVPFIPSSDAKCSLRV